MARPGPAKDREGEGGTLCWSTLPEKAREKHYLTMAIAAGKLSMYFSVAQACGMMCVCVCVVLLTRERMSRDNLLWQAQLSPQCSDLILMEVFQWLDYFSLVDMTVETEAYTIFLHNGCFQLR